MAGIIEFGIKIPEFDFKVINEREARASAGIMFLLGMLSFFSVYVFRTLLWSELFSITFIVEFAIRIFINPKYAPYMILGSLIVSHQEAEWVEAKPKKFAWILGLMLGAFMSYYILFNVVSEVRIIICFLCMVLLFLESAFGICLGCILYTKINIKLNRCPGGTCQVQKKVDHSSKYMQLIVYGAFFFLLYAYLQVNKFEDNSRNVVYHLQSE